MDTDLKIAIDMIAFHGRHIVKMRRERMSVLRQCAVMAARPERLLLMALQFIPRFIGLHEC